MRGILRKLRETSGYSQYTIASALGISRSHYEQVEQGVKNPSYGLSLKIKKLLNYSEDNLFEITSDPKDDVYDPCSRRYRHWSKYNTKKGGK